MLYKKGCPRELLSRTIKSHLNSLKKEKHWAGKCVSTFNIAYLIKKRACLGENIKQMTGTTLFAAKPKVIYMSSYLPKKINLISKCDIPILVLLW